VKSQFSLGELAQTACIWEVTARKIGNVHRFADFARTTFLDFILSAAAIVRPCDEAENYSVGTTILRAVQATRSLVGQNTNLGIILLLAPLCAVGTREPLRHSLMDVLQSLTQKDARLVFEAIRHAQPGGLGTASDQDVHEQPTVTLREAMKLAQERDRIALQYVNGYADVFDFGLNVFRSGLERFGSIEAAIIHAQLEWLAAFPDSLIARKKGLATAESVRLKAAEVRKLGGIATPAGRRLGVELDRELRAEGNQLNPGTTADLIAACMFVALRDNMVFPADPFCWQVEDWL
jgi:triphosphoribosyl-dephospho-CoA synthase